MVAGVRAGTDDPAAAQTEHGRVGVRLPIVLDGRVIPGDVQQAGLQQIDLADLAGGVIRRARVIDRVAVGGVVPVHIVTVVIPIVTAMVVVRSGQAWVAVTDDVTEAGNGQVARTRQVAGTSWGLWQCGRIGVGGRHRISRRSWATGGAHDLLH